MTGRRTSKRKSAPSATTSGLLRLALPPTFLFVAVALATLPYLTALLVSLGATLAAYAARYGFILGRTGIFVALGFPAAIWNITAGQNGFLTAALIGGTLGCWSGGRRSPVSASASSPTSRNSVCCFRWS